MPQTRMNSLKSLAMNCGPLSEMIRGLASGNFSRPRWMICSMSTSVIVARISWWTTQRLDEALALGGGFAAVAFEQAGLLEDAVDAGGATGDHVGVEHHEGQAAVALQGALVVEVDDGLLLLGLEPVVAREQGVVLVGLAVAVLPGVPLGSGDPQPKQEGQRGDAGLVGPALD